MAPIVLYAAESHNDFALKIQIQISDAHSINSMIKKEAPRLNHGSKLESTLIEQAVVGINMLQQHLIF